MDVFTSEDVAASLALLRSLVAPGLGSVQQVISACHLGLKAAIASTFPGAVWQRCRTHFARNLMTRVPKRSQALVAALLRSIFAQLDRASVVAQFNRVVDQLHEAGCQAAVQLLADALGDVLAFATFPKAHWRQIWNNNPRERLNKELRRRTDVVGFFPIARPCFG